MVQPARGQAQEGISEACTLVLICPVPLYDQCMALRSWSVNTRLKEMNSGPQDATVSCSARVEVRSIFWIYTCRKRRKR